ncbi:MAG: hypothetical protein KDJ35_02040 [Alphaproteobacteria bacterium]|nr:hypothetical protein [Alphaproteobacteria bacterium]
MSPVLSLFLDVLVMGGLAATIYFTLKLSRSLNNFRDHRKEFEGLMTELNQNIEHAYEALAALREGANRTGSDLEEHLEDARVLVDELKLMTQSGNSVAERMSMLADEIRSDEDDEVDEQLYRGLETFEKGFDEEDYESPSFAIHDREFDEPSAPGGDAGGLQSQAERELYEALQRRKKTSNG